MQGQKIRGEHLPSSEARRKWLSPDVWQRVVAGKPMSAAFADDHDEEVETDIAYIPRAQTVLQSRAPVDPRA